MSREEWEAWSLAEKIEALQEPYRQNVLDWLEGCFQRPLHAPKADLTHCLVGMNPVVRDVFVQNISRVLDEALRYFGRIKEFA
jgi:hypothetical protein